MQKNAIFTLFFSAEGAGPIWIKCRRLVQNVSCRLRWCGRNRNHADVEFQYSRRLGEFNGMSSQSHVSHCRVLPLGGFTVMIPEPHVTLQGAVTWRNQCHDRATLQGVRFPSAILKIVFRHFYFFSFLMQFRLRRAAAFVSSPIHLFTGAILLRADWTHVKQHCYKHQTTSFLYLRQSGTHLSISFLSDSIKFGQYLKQRSQQL